MSDKIFEQGVDTKLLFSIEITDTGKYFAVRTESPRFVFSGDTILDCCNTAIKALEFYKNVRHKWN